MNGPKSSTEAVVDVALLEILLRAREGRTVHALADELALEPKDVLRELDRLRRAGCRLERHPQSGVRLVEVGLGAWTDFLEAATPRRRLVVCYRSTSSTQDVARQLLTTRGRDVEGAVVTADEQTAGRGRLGRRWIAPAGSGLAASIIHHAADTPDATDRLTFATSVAVARVVERAVGSGGRITIKWPNDVQIDGRKVAGILVETSSSRDGRGAIIGIGLNTHLQREALPAELRDRVTSMTMHGFAGDRLLVLRDLLESLDQCLVTPDRDLLPEWRRRCAMLGERAAFLTHGRRVTGEVVDLDPHLGLIVRTDDGGLVHLPAATTSVAI